MTHFKPSCSPAIAIPSVSLFLSHFFLKSLDFTQDKRDSFCRILSYFKLEYKDTSVIPGCWKWMFPSPDHPSLAVGALCLEIVCFIQLMPAVIAYIAPRLRPGWHLLMTPLLARNFNRSPSPPDQLGLWVICIAKGSKESFIASSCGGQVERLGVFPVHAIYCPRSDALCMHGVHLSSARAHMIPMYVCVHV